MSSQNKICVAVDFGGTKLLIGALTRSGEILASETHKTGFREQHEAADFLLECLDAFVRAHSWGAEEPCAVGMGLVGQIDFDNGVWHKMYGREKDGLIPIASTVSERYGGIPCAIDNDVKTALAAEYALGVGRRSRNFAYVNVGTGIAAGFVCEGRIVRGEMNNAGEIGHFAVRVGEGEGGGLGRATDMEAIASGGGMTRRFRELAGAAGRRDWNPPELTANRLFQMADAGDALARRVTEDAADTLTDLLTDIVSCCAPEIIVFGGGVFGDGWMLSKIKERLPTRVLRLKTQICATELNLRTIGLQGAALLGFRAAEKETGGKICL